MHSPHAGNAEADVDVSVGLCRGEIPLARFLAAVRARLEWKKLLMQAIALLDEYESKLEAN